MEPFEASTYPTLKSTYRQSAASRLEAAELPSPKAEEWRYSPIAKLDLAKYTVSPSNSLNSGAALEQAASSAELVDSEFLAALAQRLETHFEPKAAKNDPNHSGLVGSNLQSGAVGQAVTALLESPNLVVLEDGVLKLSRGAAQPVLATHDDQLDWEEPTDDLFADFNRVYCDLVINIDSDESEVISKPVVVVYLFDGEGLAHFPTLRINAQRNSQVDVIEILVSSNHEMLIVPRIEATLAESARVRYCQLQALGNNTVQLGSQVSTVASQANFRSSLASFGGQYARMRSDCRLTGKAAHGHLDAAYFGDREQTHDFRTFQEHLAEATTSNLMFKGVVDDASHAVYTGMIRVSEDADGTEAFQTNKTIKLGEDAWAQSVPNLEIETNDVRCSHASTVGPVDENQRYYLETRGISSDAAQKMILAGFFDEVVGAIPFEGVEALVRCLIDEKLASHDHGSAAA